MYAIQHGQSQRSANRHTRPASDLGSVELVYPPPPAIELEERKLGLPRFAAAGLFSRGDGWKAFRRRRYEKYGF